MTAMTDNVFDGSHLRVVKVVPEQETVYLRTLSTPIALDLVRGARVPLGPDKALFLGLYLDDAKMLRDELSEAIREIEARS
jgi:hypothetical protein